MYVYLNSWNIGEQNKGSLDGVTRGLRLECCTFLRRQGKYSARKWSCDPSNFSKCNAEYEYQPN